MRRYYNLDLQGFKVPKVSANIYHDNIKKYLFQLTDLIEDDNSLGLTNRATLAENLFCPILNKTFGWNLVNANEEKFNQDSFDLVDKKNKIYVQVTSNKNHGRKLQSTFNAFLRKNKTNNKKLIILFISRKCSADILKSGKSKSFTYDVYDIPKLIRNIFYKIKSPLELKAVNEMLQTELEPVLLKGSTKIKRVLPQIVSDKKITGLIIKRKVLIEDIFSFTQLGNGLLVGGPGFGKSFTIQEVQRFYQQKRLPCCIIKINELIYGTDKELQEELEIDINWIDSLNGISFNHTSEKALLIYDAFDTAKDEILKSSVLKQIGKAISKLSKKWNILVSVRTFDALKSIRLLELFPQSNITKPLSCRYLEIKELTEEELTSSIKSNQKLSAIYRNSNPSLKKLLKIPYFLKLLEIICDEKKHLSATEINSIETEEQLLEIYWQRKAAIKTESDLFLKNFTEILVANENLSCKKDQVTTIVNSHILDDLISAGIITESSVTKQNISYTHNILLDFAVSKYFIPENPSNIIGFIMQNEKLPFIFRQGFIYFYSKLFKIENEIFWKHYFKTRFISSPLFRLYHQTILNYILAEFYTTFNDLNPVFNLDDPEERGNSIRKILEGIRFINRGAFRNKDFGLLLKVAEQVQEPFLWEFGFLTDKAIKALNEFPDNKNWKKVSAAACNYLKFVLQERKHSVSKLLIEGNGIFWGIQNLFGTYEWNKSAYKKLISETLDILREEDFPIRFFYALADNLIILFRHDPKFAGQVYKTIYNHNETSDKQTLLGNSVVLSLRSNRRQDFESIHHNLERDYKEIIKIAPDISIPIGIDIVNKYSIRKNSYGQKQKTFPLIINGLKARITPDFSFYESQLDKEYGPMSHAQNIFTLLEDYIQENEHHRYQKTLKLIFANAEAAIIWKQIIRLIIKYPKQLKSTGLSLLSNEIILICSETVYESGELIKSLWSVLSTTDRKTLERIILGLDHSELLKNEPDLEERRISRLLDCIPREQLIYKHSQEIVGQNKVSENIPVISSSGLQPYHASREENMVRKGVDTSNEKDIHVYELIEKVEPFNTKYDYNNTESPPKEEYESILKYIKELFEISQATHLKKELKFNCDYEVSRYAKLISRHANKLPKAFRTFVMEVGLYYIQSEEYKSSDYESGKIENRTTAFTPSPRSEATLVFVHLIYSYKTDKIPIILLSLISDNIQIVRFKALHVFTYYWVHFRQAFWDKMKDRLMLEKDGLCLHMLIKSIYYDNIIEQDKSEVESAAKALLKPLTETDHDAAMDLWSIYIRLLLKLIVKYESKAAISIIQNNLHIKSFVGQLVFEIMIVIDPHDSSNNYVQDAGKYAEIFQIVYLIIAEKFKSIHVKGLNNGNVQDEFEIIDRCIQHLYFTIVTGKKHNKGKKITIENKAAFFKRVKPLLRYIVDESIKIESGFMVAHTGYYFMQLLNDLIPIEPEFILLLASDIVNCAAANGFTYDQSTMSEVVKLSEKILADYKELLSNPENFKSIITILDQFANSGWQEALELTWRLKEVF